MLSSLATALAAASLFWGGPPPCGEPVATYRALPGQVQGRAYPDRCRIKVDTGLRHRPDRRCLVVAHEYGHLMGWGHTDHGLMSARGQGTTPQCIRLTRRRA